MRRHHPRRSGGPDTVYGKPDVGMGGKGFFDKGGKGFVRKGGKPAIPRVHRMRGSSECLGKGEVLRGVGKSPGSGTAHDKK